MTTQTDAIEAVALDSMPESSASYALRWKAMVFICISLMVISIDGSILNVALPSISRSLSAGASELQWIVDSYVLVFASLLLTTGSLDDKIGRKRGLQIGLFVFGLGSLGSALSNTAGMLTLMRALMGIGGAFIMPATLSIINASFPAHERAKAIALWAAIFGLGGGLGPLAGGLLLKFFSWQSIFLVNLPIVVVALIGGWQYISESRDEHAPSFDLVGVILSVVGLFALVFAIISAGEFGWADKQVLETFGVAFVGLFLFVIWESRAVNAMLPLRFFANPSFTLANAAVVLLSFSFYGMIFMASQYFQSVLGYEPLTVGVIQLPLVVVLMVVAAQSAKIVERFGTKRTVAAGTLLLGISLLYLSIISDINTPYSLIFVALVLFGAGFGLITSPATNSVMQSVPIRKSGVGSAMNDMTRQIGGALGIAIMGSMLNSAYREYLAEPLKALTQIPLPLQTQILRSIQGARIAASQLPDSAQGIINASKAGFVIGMQQALLVGAVVMFISSVLIFLFLPDHAERSVDVN